MKLYTSTLFGFDLSESESVLCVLSIFTSTQLSPICLHNLSISLSIFDLSIPSSIHPASTYDFITLFFPVPPHLILYLLLFVKTIHPIIHHIN